MLFFSLQIQKNAVILQHLIDHVLKEKRSRFRAAFAFFPFPCLYRFWLVICIFVETFNSNSYV
jgi:hypothetical protein